MIQSQSPLSPHSPVVDRRHWPIHLRTYAVLKEEGFPGLFLRFTTLLNKTYRKYFPRDPSEDYNVNFFEMHRKGNQYCYAIVDWLVQEFSPKDILDVGCGDCSLLVAFRERGVLAYGLDGSSSAVQAAPCQIFVIQVHLDRSLLLNRKFSIVSCIEVAEHLPAKAAKTLVSSLVRHASDVILFSAAHPGQGGIGHINERPRSYWIDLFAQYGWGEDLIQCETARSILRSAGAPAYLSQNIGVFRNMVFENRFFDRASK